jgi:hypothetical protein
MISRMILGAIFALILLMIASWTLGEFLRQRKDK